MVKLIIVLALFSVVAHGAPTPEDSKVEGMPSSTTTAPLAKKKHVETFAEVAFGGVKTVLGTYFNASQLKDMPTVEWKFEKDTFYSLIMLNFDMPTKKNPVDSDWVHWLVVNVPENDLSKGDTLVEYVGALPEKDQDSQNIIFILNEQPTGKIEFTEKFISKTDGESRKKFDNAAFSKKYGFGSALSFNSVRAEYDEYADVLRKQLYPDVKEEQIPTMEKMEEKKQEMNETEGDKKIEKKSIASEEMEKVENFTDVLPVEMVDEVVEEKPMMSVPDDMEMKCVMVPKAQPIVKADDKDVKVEV